MRRPYPLLLLFAALLAVVMAGCAQLGFRPAVDEAQARDLLTRAVGLAASGQVSQICSLSPAEASTCTDTLEDIAVIAPDSGPRIVCSVPAPDDGPLRGGHVLVVEGVDGGGEEYLTEFIVYHDGRSVGVLDAVFWSGLSVQSYSEDTVTWRFDSASTACQRGGLPSEGAGSSTGEMPSTETIGPSPGPGG